MSVFGAWCGELCFFRDASKCRWLFQRYSHRYKNNYLDKLLGVTKLPRLVSFDELWDFQKSGVQLRSHFGSTPIRRLSLKMYEDILPFWKSATGEVRVGLYLVRTYEDLNGPNIRRNAGTSHSKWFLFNKLTVLFMVESSIDLHARILFIIRRQMSHLRQLSNRLTVLLVDLDCRSKQIKK